MSREQCDLAVVLSKEMFYLVPQVNGVVFSLASFFLVFLFFRNYNFRMYYHVNFKILLYIHTTACVVLSGAVLTSFSIYLDRVFTKTDCELLFKTSFCSIDRKIFLTSFLTLTTTQMCIILERLYATVKISTYENTGYILGAVLGTFSVIAPIIVILITLSKEDPEEVLTQCLAFTASPSVSDRVYMVFTVQLYVDLSVLVAFIILYILNKRRIRVGVDQFDGITNNLQIKFQQSENLQVLTEVAPLLIVNTLVVAVYIGVARIVKSFQEQLTLITFKLILINIFAFPYLSFLLCLTFYLMVRKSYNNKKAKLKKIANGNLAEEGHIYLKTMAEQWDQGFTNHLARKNDKNLPQVSEGKSVDKY